MKKVGKVIINEQINSKRFLLIVFFSFFLFCAFCVSFIRMTIKTKDYISVKATINNVATEVSYEDEDNTYKYIYLNYIYKNNQYHYKQRVLFRFNKNIGDKVNIYINPNDPNEVRDNYNYNGCLFFSVFTLIMHSISIKLYLVRRKYNEKYD